MTAKQALWISADAHPADAFRRLITSTFPSQGVVAAGDLAVTQSGTPGMSVQVAAGNAVIKGINSTASQGSYHCYNDAAVTLTIATAPSSNSRIDTIVAQVADSDYAVGSPPNAWALAVVQGVVAASPVPSFPTAPYSYIVLAYVTVGTNVTSIVNANIADQRTRAIPAATVMSTTGPPTLPVTAAAGAYTAGAIVVDSAGVAWICTVGGSPGTWKVLAPGAPRNDLTGANAVPTRYVGAWAALGPPASGTFIAGDFGFDGNFVLQVCTVGGSPGTWKPRNLRVGNANNALAGSIPANAEFFIQTSTNFSNSPLQGSGQCSSTWTYPVAFPNGVIYVCAGVSQWTAGAVMQWSAQTIGLSSTLFYVFTASGGNPNNFNFSAMGFAIGC